ncbi:MAG: hypothetical protein ACKOX3_04600 [Bacteroidota bacterium]
MIELIIALLMNLGFAFNSDSLESDTNTVVVVTDEQTGESYTYGGIGSTGGVGNYESAPTTIHYILHKNKDGSYVLIRR